MRIVSLLPSATEIVCLLGLEDQLVGVTHECDYPESVRRLPKVTRALIPTDASSGEIDRLVRERLALDYRSGHPEQRRRVKDGRSLYTLDMPVLSELRPELIVTQALCDVCAVAESEVRAAACTLPGTPRVITLEPQTLSDVIGSIREVAAVTGTASKAEDVIRQLNARVEDVTIRSAGLRRRPRVALLEWLDPPFSCGHWSPELVRLAGGIEGLGREGQPSRTLTWDEVHAWQPEVIVVACCGFSVERTLHDVDLLQHTDDWQRFQSVRAVPAGQVYVVDGSHYFSRPGPRLVDSLEILAHILHPDVHPLPGSADLLRQVYGGQEAERPDSKPSATTVVQPTSQGP